MLYPRRTQMMYCVIIIILSFLIVPAEGIQDANRKTRTEKHMYFSEEKSITDKIKTILKMISNLSFHGKTAEPATEFFRNVQATHVVQITKERQKLAW